MNDIKLNFINNSPAGVSANVLFFLKTAGQKFDGLAVPWKVVKDCSKTDKHSFSVPPEVRLIATDNQGSYPTPYLAQTGQLLPVNALASGLEIGQQGSASNNEEIQASCDLSMDPITLNLFKQGRLLARRSSI